MPVEFRIENNIAFIEFDQPEAKVNLLTAKVLEELVRILDELQNKSSLAGVVISSLKKDVFLAGADIKEIELITDPKDGEAKSKAGQDVLNKLEDLKVPTVAVINGVALGGGCELALSCRYRVATFNEKVKIGLPEVNLGVIPGFGGTYRLPRLVGLKEAIKIISGGRVLSGWEAYKIGLVDRLFSQNGLNESLREFLDEILAKKVKPRSFNKDPLTRFLESNRAGQSILFSQSRKMAEQRTKGFYPAPLKAMDVLQKAHKLGRSRALQIEAQAFGELVVSRVSKNLIKVYYLTERFKKFLPSGAEQIKPKTIEKCAVVGAGVMGGGIAQILSSKGISVRLKDVNYEALTKGLKAAHKIYQEAVQKRKLKKFEAERRMGQITISLNYSGFAKADCVLEAVVEDPDIKKRIFKELAEVTQPETVLCTNTSALSVTEIAKATNDPSRVVGFHFFNPVHRMPLVEIIKTEFTSPETLASSFHLARRLKKTPILVKDSCGFLINRILLSYVNEAGRLLEEGTKLEWIDRIITDFGMPMGPFRLSDEVGLDIGIKVLHLLKESFGERFKPVDIFEKVYLQGLLGKKSGKGFYIHNRQRTPNPAIYQFLTNKNNRSTTPEECLQRMIYTMINEAARCLQEQIVDDPDTLDIGMILGTGFPPFRGGLIHYAKSVGIDKITHALKGFELTLKAERFRPCEYLWRLREEI